jgi:protein-S-isoprenylcysteine O-methyltransferase Ste14
MGLALPGWLKPLGIAMLLGGGFVVLYCGALLSTPGILPVEFVAFGPFRCVRNPMSLGAVTMICGLGFFYRSVSILIFAVIFFMAMHGFVVFVEEPNLEKRFGQSYLQYRQSVNRWIPRKPKGIA